MLTPISQFIPPPLFPPGNHKTILYVCDSISVGIFIFLMGRGWERTGLHGEGSLN